MNILQVLRDHFPDCELDKIDAFMTEEMLASTSRLRIADKTDQSFHLQEIGRCMNRALSHHNALDKVAAKAAGEQFKANTRSRVKSGKLGWPLQARGSEGVITTPLPTLLQAMIWSYSGKEAIRIDGGDIQQPSAEDAGLAEIGKLQQPSGRANQESTWEKVAFYRGAREKWEHCRGKPLERDSKQFLSFLQDLLFAMDRPWDAQSVCDAARRNKTQN
ncbi:hypothetical protein [Parasedimentitalea psychrophila]|uniref:Uncharacterized protein n=1 Tax=Parasedimentitalea psychrophila TaxID=2997337 RepID=A0A9Y2KZD4_9RHOB|nr:hypothetical protein [Parasedimentitalea psychrophila]WIY24816.1 hypothetical protein QPJ95_20315 [Parasedimentitalea psychrophila]